MRSWPVLYSAACEIVLNLSDMKFVPAPTLFSLEVQTLQTQPYLL